MNKSKKMKLLIIIISLTMLLFTSTMVYAATNPPYGTYQSIQTPLFRQPTNDSCWATAASMAANAMNLTLGDVTSSIMSYVGTF